MDGGWEFWQATVALGSRAGCGRAGIAGMLRNVTEFVAGTDLWHAVAGMELWHVGPQGDRADERGS
eukprot:364848-Chlamydomonas_euryale.AAC.10